MLKFKKTRTIKVGNVLIGGNNKIAIQSMTNTKTSNTKETIAQINELFSNGCDIVRVAVLNVDDANALKIITKSVNGPVVADIHFDYRLALIAIENGISKLRLNPGNISNIDHIKMVVDKCKEKHIPIRIGINSGSIQKDIYEKYGATSTALVESALENIKILEDLGFYDICVSIKSSDTRTTIEAYEKLSTLCDYPLHLGLTEAGLEYAGAIKSSVALGHLLYCGIGDTIRVSLSTSPVREVICAKEILSSLGLYEKPVLVSCPTCGRCEYNMFPICEEINNYLNKFNKYMKVAIMGCVVNGPGEAKEADIGICGGKDCGLLIRKGNIIKKLSYNQIVPRLKSEILLLSYGYTYKIEDKITEDIKSLRYEVFTLEQGFENEFDDIDSYAKYATIYDKDTIIATGRIFPEQNSNYNHIGRLCVKKEYRNKHLGSVLLNLLENESTKDVRLNSQYDKVDFYLANGYKKSGVELYDENYLHYELIKKIE